MLTPNQLRQKYLQFFQDRGHKIIPSASLIPENDPTCLFISAGMHPLVPYLMGEKHPEGQRLVDFQKCIRTGDIDDVGDDWHCTFFEMLGNWSLGDYFKSESIKWSWEFLTSKDWLGLDPERIYVSVFAGDENAPRDEESAQIWASVGVPKEKIYYYGKEENWWGPAGQTGPCGPDTEMYYDTGRPKCSPSCEPKCNCGKYSEIWNNVFMQYNRRVKSLKSKVKNNAEETKCEYEYVPLEQNNVDTGMGMERTAAVLNGKSNVYETELFIPIIEEIEKLISRNKKQETRYKEISNSNNQISNTKQYPISNIQYSGNTDGEINNGGKIIETRSIRIIADHIKAATFIMGDERGVAPSNLDQGYIVRRLIRRAIRHGRLLGIKNNFTKKIAEVVVKMYEDSYPELNRNKKFIFDNFETEEEKFTRTLQKGLKELDNMIKRKKKGYVTPIYPTSPGSKTPIYKNLETKHINGKEVFELFSTYGFPLEMTQEIAREHNINVDVAEFNEAFKKHQDLSRSGAEKKFKGGLADQKEETAKLHTATHLLHQALRQVLGDHVKQMGSNITAERLRFDFPNPEKLTPEQLKQVEDIVNKKIKENIPVICEEMPMEDAKQCGATGLFEHKYGNRVKVYGIGCAPSDGSKHAFSKEICGGPHATATGELGHFKIIKEEASSAGVRRIKAILE